MHIFPSCIPAPLFGWVLGLLVVGKIEMVLICLLPVCEWKSRFCCSSVLERKGFVGWQISLLPPWAVVFCFDSGTLKLPTGASSGSWAGALSCLWESSVFLWKWFVLRYSWRERMIPQGFPSGHMSRNRIFWEPHIKFLIPKSKWLQECSLEASFWEWCSKRTAVSSSQELFVFITNSNVSLKLSSFLYRT